MRASHSVIIVDIHLQNTPQMSSIQDEDKVQVLFPNSPNPAFGICIGIGCQVGGVHDVQAFTLKEGVKGFAELAVIVVDQET